jgi:hypothetical protein
LLGPDHPDVAMTLNNLAVLLHEQGRSQEADAPSQKALAIFEKALGPSHPKVVLALSNRALLLRSLGREAEAEQLEARAASARDFNS